MFSKSVSDHTFSVILNEPRIYHPDEEDSYSYWTLTFKVQGPLLFMEHSIEEPYLLSINDYLSFIEDKTSGLSFYQGNGDGSIECKRGYYIFRSAPSGAGGDTCTEVTCNAELFKDLFKQAIEEAIRRGYDFSKQ